mmetsp:Transcript_9288/g.21205  ORF Transcript_9288/g.21205 Transcript_9288/m.21205 type:complete len:334 (-) Transcript_9288:126-1127(-)
MLGGLEGGHAGARELLENLAGVLGAEGAEQLEHLGDLGVGARGGEAQAEDADPFQGRAPEGARVGGGVMEEVEEERVRELQPLALLDSHDQRRRKLLLRLRLRLLRPHDDHLVRAKLRPRCRLAPPLDEGHELKRGDVREQDGLLAVFGALLHAEAVDRRRKELDEQRDNHVCAVQNSIVRAIICPELQQRRDANQVRAALERTALLQLLRALAEEHGPHVVEPEATHPASDRLARVAGQEQRVGVGAREEEGLDQRERTVLDFVDEDRVDGRRGRAVPVAVAEEREALVSGVDDVAEVIHACLSLQLPVRLKQRVQLLAHLRGPNNSADLRR